LINLSIVLLSLNANKIIVPAGVLRINTIFEYSQKNANIASIRSQYLSNQNNDPHGEGGIIFALTIFTP